MNGQMHHYQTLLKTEFDSRHRRNQAYSLRAFARDLGLSPGMLSRVLSGKSAPSVLTAKKIAARMGYNAEKQKWFSALVEAQHGRSREIRNRALGFLRTYRNGVRTQVVFVKDSFDWNWYHFAIRRMTGLAQFKFSSEWIAERLRIPRAKAQRAVDDLLRSGGLIMENGQVRLPNNFSVLFKGAKEVHLRFQKDLFRKVLASIAAEDYEHAYHRRHFFTLNRSQFNEVLQLISTFECAVDDLTYRSHRPEELYCLSVDFFSVLAPDPSGRTPV